jgi:cobalt-zinc-cadmium efflux system membrane fusion protein
VVLLALVVIVGLTVLIATAKLRSQVAAASDAELPANQALPISLVAGKTDSLRVPDDVQKAIGIRRGSSEQIVAAARPTRTRSLVMPGSTALDPAGLVRVRVRFAPAEVVEIGKTEDRHVSPGARLARRDLQAGDHVHKGDLLAVLYSVDLGNKKNDLFDALSQLRLDSDVLKRAEPYKDAVPEVFLLNAQRNVQADLNAVSRAENTLKTWEIPEQEIQAVRDEVKNVASEQDRRAKAGERLKQWARVELRAPEDGYLIEQNVAFHETVVDNTTNLFQIAKVDPLIVLAAVPEDDLPVLQELKTPTRDQMRWTVVTVGSKSIPGFIDDISYLIDPNQHTAVVRGHIPNPNGLLRAGQFVTATVELPPPDDVVEIPVGALVEDGKDSIVFVQSDASSPIFTMRRVNVTNRFERTAYVSSASAASDRDPAAVQDAQSAQPAEPLHEGERVLVKGALELKAALELKLAESAVKEAPKSL